jgi:hypothetical protein
MTIIQKSLIVKQPIKDTIDVFNCYVYSGQTDVLGVLVQDSIRYEKMKKFAVYNENKYFGNYECVECVKYNYAQISDGLCKLLWGKLKVNSENELRSIIRKGRFSEKSTYKFITLFHIGETKAFRIKSKLKIQ